MQKYFRCTLSSKQFFVVEIEDKDEKVFKEAIEYANSVDAADYPDGCEDTADLVKKYLDEEGVKYTLTIFDKPKMKKTKCCICGSEFNGYGNNPDGAMCKDEKGNPVVMEFNEKDRCCDDCNNKFVIPGRIYKMCH